MRYSKTSGGYRKVSDYLRSLIPRSAPTVLGTGWRFVARAGIGSIAWRAA